MNSSARWQRLIAALKPASVRGAIVRLAIIALGGLGVTASIDPATASNYLLAALTVAEVISTVVS